VRLAAPGRCGPGFARFADSLPVKSENVHDHSWKGQAQLKSAERLSWSMLPTSQAAEHAGGLGHCWPSARPFAVALLEIGFSKLWPVSHKR